MKQPHEDSEENPAGAGGRSESGPDPDSTGSPESASDPRTVAEQSVPALAALLATRPPQPEALERFLFRLFDDPDDVDAVIQEIEALSGERSQIPVVVLAAVLLKRLDAQDARIEAQAKETSSLTAEVRAQGARIEAQAKETSSLTAEVRAQGARIDKHGDQIAELKADIGELKGAIGALGVKLDSAVRELTESNASLRRENRFMMALFAVLIALGIFGWLGESCSRPRESNAGVEASQGVGGSGRDMGTLPAETREPSTESSGTDGPAEDHKPTEDDGERSASDSGNGR